MSFGIIVRKSGYSQKSGAPRFYRHFNREITDKSNPNGMMIHTKEQYYSELKKRGLEPYDPSAKDSAKSKPVVLSDDTKQTIRAIDQQTYKGKFKPSGRLLDKMASKGVNLRPTEADMKKLAKKTDSISKGGMKADEK